MTDTAVSDQETYAIGAVFHSGDIELMRFNALSVRENAAHDEISEIHLAWNDEAPLTPAHMNLLLNAYGPLADRVQFHTRSSFGVDVGFSCASTPSIGVVSIPKRAAACIVLPKAM